MATTLKMTGHCRQCGGFSVIRAKKKRVATSGETYDTPKNLVCPSCRMWAEVTHVEEVKR